MIDRLFRLAGCKYAVPERQLDETVPVPRRKPTSLSLSIFLLSTSRSNLPFVKALGQTSLRQISGKVFKQYLVVNKTSKETISDHVNHCSVTNFAILYSEIELSIFLSPFFSSPRRDRILYSSNPAKFRGIFLNKASLQIKHRRRLSDHANR